MRKCEEVMIQAIRNHKNGGMQNTMVVIQEKAKEIDVFLHGHNIARFSFKGGSIEPVFYDWCGWHTSTTASRLNALQSAFGGDCGKRNEGKSRIMQEGFDMYHIAVKKDNGGLEYLTTYPMTQKECEVMLSKQNQVTRSKAYLIPQA